MPEVAGQLGEPGEQCVPARRQLAGRYSLPDEAPSVGPPPGDDSQCVRSVKGPVSGSPTSRSKASSMTLMDGSEED
eukprot:8851160-Pyramimonas_sp.AAC.1